MDEFDVNEAIKQIEEFLIASEEHIRRKKEIKEEIERLEKEYDAITKRIREACKGKNRDRKRAAVRKYMFKIGHSRPLRI